MMLFMGGNRKLLPILIIATIVIAAIKGLALYFRGYFLKKYLKIVYILRINVYHLEGQSFTYFE